MKTNTLIVEELTRIKQIMGLTPLNESWDKLIKQLFGTSDEVATAIKTASDDASSDFSTSIGKVIGGSGSYNDLLTYITKQGGGNTIDSLATFIQSKPDLLKVIATSSDKIMIGAAEKIIKKSSIQKLLTQTTIDIVDDLLTIPIRQNNANVIIPMIDDAITTLSRYQSNLDIADLIKKLDDRKKLAQGFNQQKTIQPLNQPVTQLVDQFDSNTEIKELLNRVVEDPNYQKKYPNVNLTSMYDEIETLSKYYGLNIKTFGDLMSYRSQLQTDLDSYIGKLQETADDAAKRGDTEAEKAARASKKTAEDYKNFVSKAWGYCFSQKGVKGAAKGVGCGLGLAWIGLFIFGTIYGYSKGGGVGLYSSQKFCPVLVSAIPIFGCDTDLIKDMCPKLCGSTQPSEEEPSTEEGGGVIPDSYWED